MLFQRRQQSQWVTFYTHPVVNR